MVSSTDYDTYLARKTAQLIRENFSERGVINLLVVQWGGKWSRTLGHIKPLKNDGKHDAEYGSIIELNKILQDPEVPEFVTEYVLIHELVHYFQGFGSNHERVAKHPHKGGVCDNEIRRIGWGEIMDKSEVWLKENWPKILTKHGLSIYRKSRKRRTFNIFRLFD
jgi:hypothetical protein